MKIAVTGSLGFIGSHLVDKLISQGHIVIGIDDMSGGQLENQNKKSPTYITDCRDFKDLKRIFKKEKPEIVYHLACNAAENKSCFSPVDITSRNYDSFIKVLTAFIKNKGKRFIFTSSIAVYGDGQVPFKEIDDPKPEDLYGITKLAAEQTLKIMSKVHNFEYIIARPHNVYGERQNMTDPYRNVVTIFMNATMKNQPYYIYGDGEQRRCFSYIDDVVEALYKCGFEDVSGMTFNVGSDKDYSVNELSKAIGGEAVHIEERTQEVKIAISDHTQSKKFLGYEDRTSLKDGIKKTWAWAIKKGPQEAKLDKLELQSKLVPSNWKK